METYTRSEQSQQISQGRKIQNGDTRNDMELPTDRGVGQVHKFFKDTYFHIPIQKQSRKYLRFHVQGKTNQFKALPFGLSTATLEFTVVIREVKLIALQKGLRIHQYLDWLVRAISHQACVRHTQTLVALCQDLGWLVNMEKSELDPKQVFDFIGYQFDLKEGKVRPKLDGWQTMTEKSDSC